MLLQPSQRHIACGGTVPGWAGTAPGWCPRPESNRHDREVEGFSCHFGFRRRHLRRSWSGARLHPSHVAVGARRLLSTPSRPLPHRAWLGVGSDAGASRAFAEFDGLHLGGFPRRAQIVQVPCVYQFHHSGIAIACLIAARMGMPAAAAGRPRAAIGAPPRAPAAIGQLHAATIMRAIRRPCGRRIQGQQWRFLYATIRPGRASR